MKLFRLLFLASFLNYSSSIGNFGSPQRTRLMVSKPSVSVAMKHFREEGYVTTDSEGGLALTDKGLKIAQRVYERHQIITKALMSIGVDEITAKEDACKIEHDISNTTFEKLKAYITK